VQVSPDGSHKTGVARVAQEAERARRKRRCRDRRGRESLMIKTKSPMTVTFRQPALKTKPQIDKRDIGAGGGTR